jgi:AraC-like DNA-binding protein
MKKKTISERAVEYILTRNLADLKGLTAEKIAESICVNRFYLSLIFMIDRKITITGFIKREKLHEAYFILEEDSKKSIDELSKELGFLKVEDFDVEFEKYFAVNPGKLKAIRKNISS